MKKISINISIFTFIVLYVVSSSLLFAQGPGQDRQSLLIEKAFSDGLYDITIKEAKDFILVYPAADNNCYSFWTITIPSWFTAMTNPVLTIRYSASNSDTWGILTSVDASSVGESMTTTTLYNAADNWTTILGANNLDKEEITLSGTISPGDNIGIRLYKNTFDTHILYIHNVFITRA